AASEPPLTPALSPEGRERRRAFHSLPVGFARLSPAGRGRGEGRRYFVGVAGLVGVAGARAGPGSTPRTLTSKNNVLPASGWFRSRTTVFSLISFTTTGRVSPEPLRAMSGVPTFSPSFGTASFGTSVCAFGIT